jgi:hypothetical protein
MMCHRFRAGFSGSGELADSATALAASATHREMGITGCYRHSGQFWRTG